MRKKRGPALYELINSKQSIGENPLKKDWGRPKREEVDLDHNVLTPGRSIRVSIGTIGVVVAVSIALIVISYTMGFRKGSAIAREDYEQNSYQQISESFTEPAVQDVPKEPVQEDSCCRGCPSFAAGKNTRGCAECEDRERTYGGDCCSG